MIENGALVAEQAVLGSMLIDSRCQRDVLTKLSADDFQLETNRAVFSALKSLSDFGAPADAVTVMDRMKQDGTFDESFTRNYILQIVEVTPTSANVMEYVGIVKSNSARQKISNFATALLEDTTSDGETLMAKAADEMARISSGAAENGLIWMKDLLYDFFESLEEKADGKVSYVQTGYRELDKLLSGGLLNSGLYYLAARPGMGKTSLALNIAMRAPGPVLYITLEMDASQITPRIVAAYTGISSERLLMGQGLTDADWYRMEECRPQIKQKFAINSLDSLNVAQIGQLARGVPDLSMVVVDYLGLIESPDRKLYEATTKNSKDLKLLARRLKVPILCLAQLNRALESRDDKRPKLSDLRDSGSIEQDADGVLMLYRGDYYDGKALKPWEPSLVECRLAKNRHGTTGTTFFNAYLANNVFEEA